MARIPWTSSETKERLKSRYLEDEIQTIRMLAEAGSTSCTIYRELELNRQVIKEVLKALRKDRHQQVTRAAIICGTRYKVYEDNRSYPVKCEVRPDCREEDSLKHMLKCCEMILPDKEADETTREQFFAQLVIKAKVTNPGHPIPIKTVKEGELEITSPPSPIRSEGEISLEE